MSANFSGTLSDVVVWFVVSVVALVAAYTVIELALFLYERLRRKRPRARRRAKVQPVRPISPALYGESD